MESLGFEHFPVMPDEMCDVEGNDGVTVHGEDPGDASPVHPISQNVPPQEEHALTTTGHH